MELWRHLSFRLSLSTATGTQAEADSPRELIKEYGRTSQVRLYKGLSFRNNTNKMLDHSIPTLPHPPQP